MPEEKIAMVTDGSVYVSVAWGKDHDSINVCTQFEHKAGADAVISIVNEWLKAAGLDEIPGREELNKLIAERQETTSVLRGFDGIGFGGFNVALERRRDVNRLIQVVKRARDDAMGRDE